MSQFFSAVLRDGAVAAAMALSLSHAQARADTGGIVQAASRTVVVASADPARGDGPQLSAAPASVTTEGQGAAQVTFSRAADHVGRPVYFSRSGGVGSAGLVSFSTRSLPLGAVFSVALAPPRNVMASVSTLRMPGTMPSLMPVFARAMTSGFGWRQHPVLGTLRAHSGIDLAASFGSPIIATSDGVVNTSGWSGGYGLLVALDHGAGLQTRYGHMSRLNVVGGQAVRKGDVIGYVGSTGMSTGPHLHYEIRVNGQAVNPATHLHGR